MKSRLCEICSIRVPLFLGPMMKVSTAPLVADFSRGEDAINKAWSAGQVAGLITRCPSVQEIFEDIINGFRETTDRLQKNPLLSP